MTAKSGGRLFEAKVGAGGVGAGRWILALGDLCIGNYIVEYPGEGISSVKKVLMAMKG